MELNIHLFNLKNLNLLLSIQESISDESQSQSQSEQLLSIELIRLIFDYIQPIPITIDFYSLMKEGNDTITYCEVIEWAQHYFYSQPSVYYRTLFVEWEPFGRRRYGPHINVCSAKYLRRNNIFEKNGGLGFNLLYKPSIDYSFFIDFDNDKTVTRRWIDWDKDQYWYIKKYRKPN